MQRDSPEHGLRSWMRVSIVLGTLVALTGFAPAARAGDDTAPALVTPPRALSDTAVAYPAGATGDAVVELELVIERDGSVKSALVRAGEPPFAEAAERAALDWHFTPARRAETAIAARIRFRVQFREQTLPASTAEDATPDVAGTPPPGGEPTPEPPPLQVTVSATRPVGGRTVSRAFALQLPGAFGNPFAALEAAPGVTPTLSGAPYFYVRGSPPGNLGYLLDDMRLPALFHVLAGPSVVHPALVESVDFYPGPYPARYGRFTGGIAAGQVKSASYALHGEASVRAFDSSGLLEVPLGEQTSASVSGRVSYANPIARLFAPDVSVSYWDYQVRLSHRLSPRDELSVFAFGSRDALDRKHDDGSRQVVFGSEFQRVQLRYQQRDEAGSATVLAVAGWDRSAQADGKVRLTDTLGQLRADYEHDLNQSWRLQAGVDAGLDRYSLRLGELEDPNERSDYLQRFPTRLDQVAGGAIWQRNGAAPGSSPSRSARASTPSARTAASRSRPLRVCSWRSNSAAA